MKRYHSKSGKPSGVSGYDAGSDWIVVCFGNMKYKYTYISAGRAVVERMKTLAQAQRGLSTFISRVRPGYEE